jgi:hypothetical protein
MIMASPRSDKGRSLAHRDPADLVISKCMRPYLKSDGDPLCISGLRGAVCRGTIPETQR